MQQLSFTVSAAASEETEEREDQKAQEPPEPQVYSISELNHSIRGLLEGKFPLLWVRGEISNFKAQSSGHWYFSLKDDKAQISGVMFRGHNSRLKFRPDNGMEVLIRGRVTVYEPRGNYQVFCELMEPVGAGALQKAFEQLKSKLEKEGLFNPAKKRALPRLPQHVAIVTSPTGAAVRDMLNVLGRRFRGLKITVIPAVVQGDLAPASIIQGIEWANKLTDVDVLIVGRGGGSIEDLWAFNDERVARALAASRLPTISAVGHEIDFTIADFVADLRAPTPSAAAELVVQSAGELIEQLRVTDVRLSTAYQRWLSAQVKHIENLRRHLIDPRKRLTDLAQRNDECFSRLEHSTLRYFETKKMRIEILRRRLTNPQELVKSLSLKAQRHDERLIQRMNHRLEQRRARLQSAVHLLDSLSPLKVVERGYAMVTINGAVVRSIGAVETGDSVKIRLADGELTATVHEKEKIKQSEPSGFHN